METKKLTTEEIEKIQVLKNKFEELTQLTGNIELQIIELNFIKENIKNEFIKIKNDENVLAKELEEKYGNGSISLETGEFIAL
jgi:hypothetical protein